MLDRPKEIETEREGRKEKTKPEKNKRRKTDL